MGWGTRILTISLLITVILVSGCAMNFGSNKLDFGNSAEAQQLQTSFCLTYGDPTTYNGPPRFVAPVSSTGIKDNIPSDKVTKFSTDTDNIYFWVVYQNFPEGEDLNLSWIYQDKVVTTITKKTDRQTGLAFSQFVRPNTGWPTGTHTIRIEGKQNSTQVKFEVINGPTERTPFDFSRPETIPNPTVIVDDNYWIWREPGYRPLDYFWVSCTDYPDYPFLLNGATGTSVTPGTKVQIILQNKPDSLIQDLPAGGVVIDSTKTVKGGWEYLWDTTVPGYTLLDGQKYILKYVLPNGKSYEDPFIYECKKVDNTIQSPDSEDPSYSIMGGGSNDVLSCSAPNNTLKFSGSTGSAVSPGTVIQFIVFNKPGSGIQDLPADGILIGSTNTRNDGSWDYLWNGNVPGYTLTNGQTYGVKCMLPSGKYTLVGFVYQCTVQNSVGTAVQNYAVNDPGYTISGGASNDVLSCSAPNNALKFSGSTGSSVSPGTVIQFIVFNKPGSGIQDLPADGILIGTMKTRTGGAWDYSWNGNVPGYTLTNGQTYGVKCMLPSGKYTLVGFVYQCA